MKLKIILLMSIIFINIHGNNPMVSSCEEVKLTGVTIDRTPKHFSNDPNFKKVEVSTFGTSKTKEATKEEFLFSHTKKGDFAQLIAEKEQFYTHKNLGKVGGAITDIHIIPSTGCTDSKTRFLCINYTTPYLKQKYIALGTIDQGRWVPLKIKCIKNDDQLYYSGGVFQIHNKKNDLYTNYSLKENKGKQTLQKKVTSICPEKDTRFFYALAVALKRRSIKGGTF